jgi:hypothetical protein
MGCLPIKNAIKPMKEPTITSKGKIQSHLNSLINVWLTSCAETKNEDEDDEQVADMAIKNRNEKFKKVELIIQCTNLPSLDTFSLADPLVALFIEEKM